MTDQFGTSYFGVRDPEHARRDLDRFRDRGLNGILHTVSERDSLYYTDTMKQIVSDSHERDFDVHVNPWGVGNVFGGEALSRFSAKYPDSRQVLSNGSHVPAACLNAPTFREFMNDWIDRALELNPDVLFWDEPHWYTPQWRSDAFDDEPWTCRCPQCRRQFEDQFGHPMPEEQTEEVDRFRDESLIDFLQELLEYSTKRDVENAVCVMPGDGELTGLSRWDELAGLDHLDWIATTPYWQLHGEPVEPFVTTWSDRLVTTAEKHNLNSQLWIQGFNLPDGGSDEVRRATEIALNTNPDSLFIWGWDGCRSMSQLACESPDEIWQRFLDSVHSFKPPLDNPPA